MKYCIDVYLDKQKWWMHKYNFKEKRGKYGVYYTVKVGRKEKNKIVRKLNWRKIKYRCYEECWNRSSDYRKNFFKHYSEPYRCRYCNKKLTKNTVVIDHIIPIYQTKTSPKARNMLKMRGINNVNDIRNLAPSCWDCNERKGEKMGLWLFKAWIGRYEIYWKLKPLITIMIIGTIVYYILKSGAINEFLYLIK